MNKQVVELNEDYDPKNHGRIHMFGKGLAIEATEDMYIRFKHQKTQIYWVVRRIKLFLMMR